MIPLNQGRRAWCRMGKTSLDSEATTSNHLLYIMVSLLNTTQCKSEWDYYVKDNNVCFKARDTTSETASGDSGSGLIVKHTDTNTLMAVYAGGSPGHNISGVYTNIKPFVPWIKREMGWKSV
ncbi:venom prothrombin activator trocarin-D-like [Haliotis rubra]|uniref:venom prothrombin activator trocarin-D-like n=1 Tax=Haliotis rubra TaxID=36100 RepID=UPI001EE628B6|nr:venom prothrombin activator trocarin-D-like [Haliotis rubra]